MATRLLLFLTGLALLPCSVAATRALLSTLLAAQPSLDQTFSPPVLAFFGGFGLWVLIFVALPQPTRAYVLAHELTHALWAQLMGKKVLGMKVGAKSGAVMVSESNALIALAPYFFPLYTVFTVLLYYGLGLLVDLRPYWLLWLGLVGLTWSFHVTFTVSTLMSTQSDVLICGRLFSYTFIYIMNVLSVALWVVLASDATTLQFGRFLWRDLAAAWGFVFDCAAGAFEFARNLLFA